MNMSKFKTNNAGRPKGSLNKKTSEQKKFFQEITKEFKERFREELNTLKGEKFCNVYLQTVEFNEAKLQRVQLSTEEDSGLIDININYMKPNADLTIDVNEL